MLPGIGLVLEVEFSDRRLGPVHFIPRAHGGGIVREAKGRPVSVVAGGAGDLDNLGQQFLLRLVVGEDVLEVKVLRGQV